MRRVVQATAVLMVALAVAAILGMPGGGAQAPSMAGPWEVTVGGGQPRYLLALTADGSAISTGSSGTTYIGEWAESDGNLRIDLGTLSVPGGPQGLRVEGPIVELENGRISIGGDLECSDCWVLTPYGGQ